MKERINVFLSKDVISILDRAKKIVSNPHKKASRGILIEVAVKKVYQDRIQILKDQMKSHQKELMKLKEEKELLEEKGRK